MTAFAPYAAVVRSTPRRLAAAMAVVFALWTGSAAAGSIDLTTGTSGTLLLGQSFNETRAVDVTVLSGSDLHVSSMTLKGLNIGAATSVIVGARVYASGSTLLVATADLVITSAASPITVPISATLASGVNYRVGFFVATTPGSQGSGALFDPTPVGAGGFPYVVPSGQLRVNGGFQIGADAFPANASFSTVPQVSLDATPASFDLTSGAAGSLSGVPQSFNETRGIDVTLLAPPNLHVGAMRLTGLGIGGASSALVGARIYASSGALLASANATVTSVSGPITVPISATLVSGSSYRVAFFVSTTPPSQASATLFDPSPAGVGGFPYVESSGTMRINQAYSIATDAFPSNVNFFVPQIQVLTTIGQWVDLGHALAGTVGLPHLVGTGSLVGGTFVTSTVSKLLPNSVATLVVGFSAINAPFKGGVWVPALDLFVPGLPTGPSGVIDLPSTWPMNVPSGFTFYEQYWQQDAGAVKGFSASNAISGTTP